MKKEILLGFAFALPLLGMAQNVGIGTSSPAEKLDVAGNINVTGTIKANGAAGNAGQVLGTNASGGLEWLNTDRANYRHTFMVSSSGATNFTIPTGVTEIMVEQIGGGGGGARGGGGAAGNYTALVLNVSPGASMVVFNGNGGAGATCFTCDAVGGSDSYVNYNAVTYYTDGGWGAGANYIGYPIAIRTYSVTSSLVSYFSLPGAHGEGNTGMYFQLEVGGSMREMMFGGRGGNPVMYGFGAPGTNYTRIPPASTYSFHSGNTWSDNRMAKFGGGGGGGYMGVNEWGSAGATGVTIIRW